MGEDIIKDRVLKMVPRQALTRTSTHFNTLQEEAFLLFLKKNADYGDSFKEDGVLGVLIRAKDKINRYISLARKEGEARVKDERPKDTLMDLSNYALMAIIAMEDGEHGGNQD